VLRAPIWVYLLQVSYKFHPPITAEFSDQRKEDRCLQRQRGVGLLESVVDDINIDRGQGLHSLRHWVFLSYSGNAGCLTHTRHISGIKRLLQRQRGVWEIEITPN